MAEANVRLTVDARNAVQQLQRANTATRNLDTSVKGVSRSAATATANIQRFGIAFRSVIGPIVAITGAVNLASRSLRVLGERQADAAALENGLKKVGAASSELQRLIAVADRLGKATLFNEEDFTKGFALLTSFQSIAVSSYERVAKAAADVAQVTRQDVGSSLLQLAKALQDPERGLTALARSGTQFTEQQKTQIEALVESGRLLEAQNFILLEIEKQYGNAAQAAGSAGYAGAVDSLQESFRDFQERLAEGIQPAVTTFLGTTAQLFDFFSKIPTPVGQAALAIGGVTAAVIALNTAVKAFLASKIAAFIGTQIALMKAFGVQIYAAAAAQGALTAAVKAFQVVVAASPWALAVLGLGLVAAETYKAIAAQAEYNRILSEAPLDEVTKKIGELREQLTQATIESQNAAAGMSLMGGSAEFSAPKIAQLNTQLGELISRQRELALYQKVGVTPQAGFYGPGFAAPPAVSRPSSGIVPTGGALRRPKVSDAQREELRRRQEALALEEAATQAEEQKQLAFEDQVFELQKQQALQQAKLDGNEKEVANAYLLTDLIKKHGVEEGNILYQGELQLQNLEDRVNAADKLAQEQKKAAEELQQIYAGIGMAIKDGVVQAIQGAIDGTKTLKEVAVNLLNNIANQLLQIATNLALFGVVSGAGTGGGLLGGLFKPRAQGGTVAGGQPYVVGERGPELFMPGRSGSIIPNNALGGNITVNVDATGTQVQGDQPNANKLGEALGAAVRAELIRQKRPGGLLA